MQRSRRARSGRPATASSRSSGRLLRAALDLGSLLEKPGGRGLGNGWAVTRCLDDGRVMIGAPENLATSPTREQSSRLLKSVPATRVNPAMCRSLARWSSRLAARPASADSSSSTSRTLACGVSSSLSKCRLRSCTSGGSSGPGGQASRAPRPAGLRERRPAADGLRPPPVRP